jgi:hypothetical protein
MHKGAIAYCRYADICGNDNVFFLPALVLNQNRTPQDKILSGNQRLPALPGKIGFQVFGKEGDAQGKDQHP